MIMNDIIQFDWAADWKGKVKPHLKKEIVQICLDAGMRLLSPEWKRGDAPYLLGGTIDGKRARKGTLRWYQPFQRCHWISFFSMAIGVINYPDLEWKFVSGDLHTVPVGYEKDGSPRVVMDILLFNSITAEQSIACATKREGAPSCVWDEIFKFLEEFLIPIIRATCI